MESSATTAIGRSATVESERERFDGRQSQFDPKPKYTPLESRHSNRAGRRTKPSADSFY